MEGGFSGGNMLAHAGYNFMSISYKFAFSEFSFMHKD